jgi:hypothetical protein
MKKVEKGKKKLEVKKEKVRPLTDEDLDKVAGGATVVILSVSKSGGIATRDCPSGGSMSRTTRSMTTNP